MQSIDQDCNHNMEAYSSMLKNKRSKGRRRDVKTLAKISTIYMHDSQLRLPMRCSSTYDLNTAILTRYRKKASASLLTAPTHSSSRLISHFVAPNFMPLKLPMSGSFISFNLWGKFMSFMADMTRTGAPVKPDSCFSSFNCSS